MWANKLKIGDTIGLISPSHIVTVGQYENIIATLKNQGFKVKTGKNLYKNTYGYSATEAERAGDLNDMVSDKDVKLIFFGGGNGSIDLLPLINYENIKQNPKAFLSYSDGTSILNAIYSKTGLITYYGQTPGNFENLSEYTIKQFFLMLVNRDETNFIRNSVWHTLNDGVCEGLLIGGYLWNFALSLSSAYFEIDKSKKYILFLEDNEKFASLSAVSALLSHVEQSNFMKNVAGLLFGNYSDVISQQLLDLLRRFGEKNRVPVAYCDDFGHGENHAILPVGCHATLNTTQKSMKYAYSSE